MLKIRASRLVILSLYITIPDKTEKTIVPIFNAGKSVAESSIPERVVLHKFEIPKAIPIKKAIPDFFLKFFAVLPFGIIKHIINETMHANVNASTRKMLFCSLKSEFC